MKRLHYGVADDAPALPAIGYGVLAGLRTQDVTAHVAGIRPTMLARIQRDAVATRQRLRHYSAYFADRGAVNPLVSQLDRALTRGVKTPDSLVEALLLTELASGILMGIQDEDKVAGDLYYDVAVAGETFAGMRGGITCKNREPVLRDDVAIIASLLQGPDARTQISTNTRNALILAFAVPGVPDHELTAAMELLRDVVGQPEPNCAFRIEHGGAPRS